MAKLTQSIDIQEINVFKRHSTTSLFDTFLPVATQIDRYATLALFSFGIIGNIVSIIVWWYPRLRIRECTVLSLIIISALDLLYLLLTMVVDFERVWSVTVFYDDGVCKVFQVARNACSFYSLFMVLTVCMQYVLSLKNPDNYEYYKSKKWTYLVAVLLAVVSVLFSIAEGYFSSIKSENAHVNECSLPRDILVTSKSYQVYYWMVKFFLVSVLIISISGICIYILHRSSLAMEDTNGFHRENCQLQEKGYCWCGTKRSIGGNKNNLSTTKMITIVGFYTVFIAIPQLILVSLEPLNTSGDLRMSDFEVLEDPVWERYFNIEGAKIIFNELYLSQFSIKIVIYFCCNKYFRQCFIVIFGLGKFVDRFFGSPKKPDKQHVKRSVSKPVSYYIDRTKNSCPFTNEKHVVTAKPDNLRVNKTIHPSNVNVVGLKRLPEKRIIERSGIKSDQILEPIYYTVPRPRSHKRHVHHCNRLSDSTGERNQPVQKIQSKQFHNVCSEFQYNSSSSSSFEESPAIYAKNRHYYLSSESDSSSGRIVLKSKKSNCKYHRV